MRVRDIEACYDWRVPNFILWDILGMSTDVYGGRQTFTGILLLDDICPN